MKVFFYPKNFHYWTLSPSLEIKRELDRFFLEIMPYQPSPLDGSFLSPKRIEILLAEDRATEENELGYILDLWFFINGFTEVLPPLIESAKQKYYANSQMVRYSIGSGEETQTIEIPVELIPFLEKSVNFQREAQKL